MTQIAQLSASEIEDRFHVTGNRPVAFLLAGFAKARDQFSVMFHGGGEMYLTTLLGVDPDKNRLFFDCSGSVETNRHLQASDHLVFVGRPAGIHVQFSTGPVTQVTYEGARAFSVALPDHVVRLQRREYFRIETPRMKPLEFFGRMPDDSLLKLPVHDISIDGLGAMATALPDAVTTGVILERCHFALPGDDQDLFFSAAVRHITPQQSRSGTPLLRVGMEFLDLPSSEEMRIQRYIVRIERERHELGA